MKEGEKTMYKEKIDAYIDSHREEMLKDLSMLVKIDSTRGEEQEGKPYGEGPAAVLDAAAKLLESCGLKVRNYGNRVITGDFSDQEKALDILAHLDVVPVTEADWTVTKPFEPKIVGDRIYGRGTADDKGPAIAALYAIRAIRELGIPLKKSVRLILGSDEECGSSDLEYYYGIEEEAPFSFTPDADFPLINIEKGRYAEEFTGSFTPNGNLPRVERIKSGTKRNVVPAKAEAVLKGISAAVLEEKAAQIAKETGTSISFEQEGEDIIHVKVTGLAAHASTPEVGKNALCALLELCASLPLAESDGQKAISALAQMFPFADTCGKALGIYASEPESGELTMCLSVLDYTPEGLRGEFDSRLPVGCSSETVALPMDARFKEAGLTIASLEVSEPHCVPGDSWFVQTLLSSYERYFGKKGVPLSTGGGTYVHHLKRGVAFGCMTEDVDNHMHGDDEFMEISRFTDSAKIFADAIIKICG